MIKKEKKTYDVVILTHEPQSMLIDSLNLLKKQKAKPKNIIIYNTDEKVFYKNIKDIVALKATLKSKNVKLVHIEKKDFDHGKARNDAMKLCTSDYVLFMTDDAVPYDNMLSTKLMEGFTDKKVAVTYARQIAKKEASKKEKYVREFNYPNVDIVKDKTTKKQYGIKNCFCSNSCAMYDRLLFNKLGRFKIGLPQNEDMLFAYKAIEKGYKVVYKSKAMVYHSHNLSYLEQFKRNRDIGKFQKINKKIYKKFKSEGEGFKLIKFVNEKFIREKKYLSLIDFNVECIFRYLGYLVGKCG